VLRWLAVTLAAYAVGGLWLGTQMRPAVARYENMIVQNISGVTSALR